MSCVELCAVSSGTGSLIPMYAATCQCMCAGVPGQASARVASIVAGVVDGGDIATVSVTDARWLVDTSTGSHGIAAGAVWDTIAAVCTTGDAVTNRTRFAEARAFSSAASTLRRADVDGGTVAACLRAVANMCGGSIIAAAVGAGVVEAVVGAMGRLSDSADVASCGCQALVRLGRVDSVRVAIAGAGGIDVVVAAMRRHADAGGVQQLGCAALCYLAANGANQAAIAGAGGSEMVLTAMRRHADAAGVQASGCGALLNLADNAANRVAIAGAGGIEAVVSAMRRHADAPRVQEYGCCALRNLATDSAANKVAIAAAGGIDVVVGAMRRHADAAGVQDYGCSALWILAVNVANQPQPGDDRWCRWHRCGCCCDATPR
jgi:hypothetical protein